MNLAAFLLEPLACRAPWRAQRSLQLYAARLSSNRTSSGDTVAAAGYCYSVSQTQSQHEPIKSSSLPHSGTSRRRSSRLQVLVRSVAAGSSLVALRSESVQTAVPWLPETV